MEGSTLLSRVHAAYLHVSAVEQSSKVDGLRFVVFLRDGTVTAEEIVATGPPQAIVIAHRNRPTYARDPMTHCWRPAPNYRHVLTYLGSRFPDALIAKMQAKTARRAGSFWLLPLAGHGRTGTLRIDAQTLRVMSLTALIQGGTATVYYRTLMRMPTLPTPRPLCRK